MDHEVRELIESSSGSRVQLGLGDEPRKVLDELRQIKLVDIVLPTRQGPPIRQRCVSRPTDHQAILLHQLGLHLPERFKTQTDVVKPFE